MNNLVEINNVVLGIKEFAGQRVVTFKDIDRVHNRPNGTSRKAFNRNKRRLIEGKDYFMVKPNVRQTDIRGIIVPNRGITVITESGYLLLVKVFDDDIAWKVQRKLVSTYFRAKEENIHMDTQQIALKTMADILAIIQQDITTLKEQQNNIQKQLPKKRFSSWASKMFPKYQLLMDYFDISLKELFHNLFIELENLYPEIDLSQEQDDYCFENGLDSCFTMDIIEHNRNLRKLFEAMVDNLLQKYNLMPLGDNTISFHRGTIFDD
ncbi:hypothetical protein GKG47_08995 [Lactonifactor sp. BIOML-A3]|uniref:ORF6N domain-containing protein n=1 Tax=unclassified Lactonifactor TaxID=2636670 RepID=UPI0012AF2611|nr:MULTISPECIES: ORF6N domain-containing protein [unclassified Lactonifactor]MSA02175.1 hypothetical protein [Lactonifactor sp. BIOML-A5]MSA07960.1 hypothetical protein [Lactonifactor sp. BIOML-A4]MSA12576.1 hypothetical protein [Lactonifactor sp. BIOML-A3]MSA16723.1 hypothetical protein [Lactonifactor sp. BIOML-A2]MSA37578.1 hypothetical protein [Lactonifactor sp. BIOML-A1]